MVLHRRPPDTEQVGDLLMGPSEPVAQHNGDALLLRQPGERAGEARLDPRRLSRFIATANDDEWATLPARAALPDAEQVCDRMCHLADPLPVLPRVRERVGRRLTPDGRPVGGSQRTAESRFCHTEERFEPRIRQIASHGPTKAPNPPLAPQRRLEPLECRAGPAGGRGYRT